MSCGEVCVWVREREMTSDPSTLDLAHARQTKAALGETFFPALPERLYRELVRLPGASWALYQVLMYRTRTKQATVALPVRRLSVYGMTRNRAADAYAALAG